MTQSFDQYKRKFLESLQSLNFKELGLISDQLFKFSSTKTNDILFQIGLKTLQTITNLKHKTQIIASNELFYKWFDFCLSLNHKQNNSILRYGVIYVRTVASQKLHALMIQCLDRLKILIEFPCDCKNDSEKISHMKYLAPLSYNQSIDKELNASDIQMALNFFVHSVEFYVKISSNFYVLLNTTRVIDNNLLRATASSSSSSSSSISPLKILDQMYEKLFRFFVDSLSTGCPLMLEKEPFTSQIQTLMLEKQINVRKFFLAIYLNYFRVYSTLLSSSSTSNDDLANKKKLTEEYLSYLKKFFDREFKEMAEKYIQLDTESESTTKSAGKSSPNESSKLLDYYRLGCKALDLLDSIRDYIEVSEEKKTKSSKSSTSKKTASSGADDKEVLIKQKFTDLQAISMEKRCFYHHWILNSLLEIFTEVAQSKVETSCTIAVFVKVFVIFVDNCKRLYATNNNSIENISRLILFKPFYFFITVSKLIETAFQKMILSKTPITDLYLEAIETLWKHNNSYLKWVTSTYNQHDELFKMYNQIELQTIRILNFLYTSTKINQNQTIQTLGMELSFDRISYMIKTAHPNIKDPNQFRHFKSIFERFLSSLRIEERYELAQKMLKKCHEFLASVDLDTAETELIVVNWCKIKRDMARDKNDSLKKTTIVDFLKIKPTLTFSYLFEELNTYAYLRVDNNTNVLIDDIFSCLSKLESLPTSDPIIKSRVYLEIAQFKLNDSNDLYKDRFKMSSSNEYMEKAEKYLNEHKTCTKSIESSLDKMKIDDHSIEPEHHHVTSSKENCKPLEEDDEDVRVVGCYNSRKRVSQSPLSASPSSNTNTNETPKQKAASGTKKRRIKLIRSSPISLTKKKPDSPIIISSPTIITDLLTPKATSSSTFCNCVEYRIIRFQIEFLRFLCLYARARQKQLDEMLRILETHKTKQKEENKDVVQTNVDNLNLQTQSTNSENLLFAEYRIPPASTSGGGLDESIVEIVESSSYALVDQLDRCSALIEELIEVPANLAEISHADKSLLKQFIDSIELLGHINAFFGYCERRANTFKRLVKLIGTLVKASSKSSSLSSSGMGAGWMKLENLYSNACVNFSRSLLDMHQCDRFESFMSELLGVSASSLSATSTNTMGSDLTNKPSTKQSTSRSKKTSKSNLASATTSAPTAPSSYIDRILEAFDGDKFLQPKPNVSFYLILAHYLILRHRFGDAIKLMKERILESDVLNGRNTTQYYEARHYLKYLQFLLSMMNLDKHESAFIETVDNETPLSLIEDSYCASFSVTRYFVENSVEPVRVIVNALKKDEKEKKCEKEKDLIVESQSDVVTYGQIFFEISNADHYRSMAQFFDTLHTVSKFYLDLSRCRDFTGYIKEALEVSQLHYVKKRVTQYLLLQLYCHIIAENFTEASNRLEICTRLIPIANDTQLLSISSSLSSSSTYDLVDCRNYIQLVYLHLLLDVKQLQSTSSTSTTTKIRPNDDVKQSVVSRLNLIRRIVQSANNDSGVHDYCKDLIIDTLLISWDYFLHNSSPSSSSAATAKETIAKLLSYELNAGSNSSVASLKEKWQLAEYNCYKFEDSPRSAHENLALAHAFIRRNPPPLLYRRICMNLFNSEPHLSKRIMHLFETQSIALRHKACSIQIKQKRKAMANMKIFEILMNTISFESASSNSASDYLSHFLKEILPSDCVCVSLMLDRESDWLYLIRLEKDVEPLLVKLKYQRRFADEFRQIMSENDVSMKESDRKKFWNARNSLNKRLSAYLQELEDKVFGHYRSLLIGSYGDDATVEKTTEKEFKRKFAHLMSLTDERLLTIKCVSLGLDRTAPELIREQLKASFDSIHVPEIEKWLCDVLKPKLAGLKRKHVCLIVDRYLHQIPWECMKVTINQPMSRMPSIHFLYSHIQLNSLSIDKEKGYYIVDPGNDLAHTREKFRTFFEQMKSWKGIVGMASTEEIVDAFKKALTEHELFIYTGHGSGSQYYPSEDVQKLRIKACSILMGCSSGNQYVMGEFEPHGTVLAYVLAGCPCIVGNLWDVTDRDIDKLTEEFLRSWITEYESSSSSTSSEQSANPTSSICNHLIRARKACKLTYLNGSAPIVYGLPVKFK